MFILHKYILKLTTACIDHLEKMPPSEKTGSKNGMTNISNEADKGAW